MMNLEEKMTSKRGNARFQAPVRMMRPKGGNYNQGDKICLRGRRSLPLPGGEGWACRAEVVPPRRRGEGQRKHQLVQGRNANQNSASLPHSRHSQTKLR